MSNTRAVDLRNRLRCIWMETLDSYSNSAEHANQQMYLVKLSPSF